MHSNIKDLTSQQFGKLQVVGFVGRDKKRQALWNCSCACGGERVVAGTYLITGDVTHCGCDNQRSVGDTDAEAGTRVCRSCKEAKPLADFHRNHRCTGGRISRCKTCCKASTDTKSKWLKTRYGISREQFDAMLARQDGRCAICARPMEKPFVDHCHKTGVVRGLLCGPCNSAIGLFGENRETMERAIAYLTPPPVYEN
jgi:hypothetical protein